MSPVDVLRARQQAPNGGKNLRSRQRLASEAEAAATARQMYLELTGQSEAEYGPADLDVSRSGLQQWGHDVVHHSLGLQLTRRSCPVLDLACASICKLVMTGQGLAYPDSQWLCPKGGSAAACASTCCQL